MKTLRRPWQVTTLLLAVMLEMARATTTNNTTNNTTNTYQGPKQRKLGVPLALLLMLSVLTCGALAGNCMDDVSPLDGLVCTANDVRVAQYNVIDGPTSIIAGEYMTVTLQAELIAGASERYDIGFFVALDGGDALNGSCFREFLLPPLCPRNESPTCIYDPMDGPFYNAEYEEDINDTCGDLEQGVTNYRNLTPITIIAQDSDGDGIADVGTCVSWDNGKSDGTANKPSCTCIEDALPNTKSKCRCEAVRIGNIKILGQIIVDKVTSPSEDPQSFNFTLTGPNNTDVSFSLTDQDAPFESEGLESGTYNVTEFLPDYWDLTSATCSDGSDPGAIELGPGEIVTCTFNNVLVFVPAPDYSINKTITGVDTAGDGIINNAGEIIDYQIVVTNDGNVDLTGVSVTDPLLGTLTGPTGDATDPGVLNVGETWTYTGSYTVQQSDLNNDGGGDGDIDNTATVSSDDLPDETDSEDEPVVRDLNYSIDKTITGVDTAGDGIINNAGEIIDYQIVVTNDGNVDLTGVSVTDPLLGTLTGPTGDATDPGVLNVGETWTYTGSYTVQQSDLDNDGGGDGDIDNTATVSSDDLPDETDSEDEPVVQNPSINLTKVMSANADEDESEDVSLGDTLTYTFNVTNDGNVNLDPVTVTDPMTGLSLISCGATNLTPDASTTCTASYTVKQADVDAGGINNTATATGTPLTGENVTDTDDEEVTVPQNPSIDVEKYMSIDGGTTWEDADDPTGPYLLSGTDPQFKFVVNNTGNVNLASISLTDSDFDLSGCTPTDPLAPGASFECSVTGTWAAGQHTNTASVTVDFGGQTYSDADDANYYGADPDFTVTKLCDSTEPVPQLATEANFEVEFENTGNVELNITADDGIGTFTLTTGATKTFTATINGPFSGQPTVNNTVNASSTYTDSAGNTETVEGTDDGFCRVGGLVTVKKLTQGEVNSTVDWTFTLYEVPDGYGGDELASSSTFGDTDGILVFGDYNLDPDKTYTVCENEIPAGWTSFWQVDTNGDGVADTTVIPYNPNQYDDPPEDLGNRCFDIGAGTTVPIPAGGMVFFQIDNTYPGGEPRTPGYWKNWNNCTGGGQAATADQNGGWQAGYWLLEDVLDPNIGGGIVWDDIQTDDLVFNITTCERAVSILDTRDFATGKKRANDGAYTLAMHLLAAQMNFAAGAESCQEALDASLDAEELLDKHDFTGEGSYLSSKDDDYAYALELAEILDQYNNGELCTP